MQKTGFLPVFSTLFIHKTSGFSSHKPPKAFTFGVYYCIRKRENRAVPKGHSLQRVKKMENTYTFKRKENKYLITPQQHSDLLELAAGHLEEDGFPESTVCNIYLDTPTDRLIRESIDVTEEDRPYKEKLRIRAYGIPEKDDTVFIELKKKFKGIVYKRRISTTLSKAESYLKEGRLPEEGQIMNEIDYTMRKYGMPQPSVMVFYERKAWHDKDQSDLRITFDRNTRYRTEDLSYEYGSAGKLLLPGDTRILEIKACGAYPFWLCEALDSLSIRKQTFSKVATAYKKEHYKESKNEQYIRIDNREQLLTWNISHMPDMCVRLRADNLLCGKL